MTAEDREFDLQVRRGLITIAHAFGNRYGEEGLFELMSSGTCGDFLVKKRFLMFGVAYIVKVVYNQIELRLEINKE